MLMSLYWDVIEMKLWVQLQVPQDLKRLLMEGNGKDLGL